jgi:zinc protease
VRRLYWLAVTVLLLSSCSASSPGGDSDTAPVPQIAIEKHRLENGLDVLFVEDHRLPRVAVNVWYHVGPVNEEPGRTGFAHLFEHMMFQQSKHVPPDQLFKMLEEVGASDINGTTSFDRTNYFETVPTSELELALWLESDRMGYLLDKVDVAALENQQDVVRNERRQSIENTPFGIVEEAVYQNLYPKGHPYYGYVMGSHADIQAAKLDDVRRFFKQYYSPNNASLAIVGDIDKAATLKLVEKYFGTLKKGPDVPQVQVTTPAISAERRLEVKDRVELPRLYMAWLTPSIFQPGDAEADLASQILGKGKSSRLYRRLVYDKQIAQDVSVYQSSQTLASVFVIQATARPGHSLDELEKETNEVLEALRTQGPEAKEIERAKTAIETDIFRGLERFGGFGGIADRIQTYNHFVKNPDYLAQDVQRYRDVTSAQIQEFAQKYLASTSRVVIRAVPGEPDFGPAVPTPAKSKVAQSEGEAVNADEAWRNERPAAGNASDVKVPAPESFQLANGLTVLLHERKNIPVVSAQLVFRSGSGHNPADKPGLAAFTADMLDEGTSTRSSLQFADEMAQIGAAFDVASRRDFSFMSLTSMSSKFAVGLDLIADTILNPTFPQEEIERVRKSRLASLVQLKEDPDEVANRIAALAINGPNDPFGPPSLGTEASVAALKQDELKAFWSEHMKPNNAGLIVSGDIEKDELKTLLEKVFANWKSASSVAPVQQVSLQSSSRVIVVDKPGAQQTQLRIVLPGVPRSVPEYETIEAMNGIFGGNFSSRINLNLREDKGFTYGAFSAFSFLRGRGWFTAYAPVRSDVTAAALREIFREIGRITETPVTADELKLAKKALLGQLPASLETNAGTVGLLAELYEYDLPLDYYTSFSSKVSGVTESAVQEAARKYLIPKNAIVVAVGDRAKIEPELRKLNLGPIEFQDLEGKPVGNKAP